MPRVLIIGATGYLGKQVANVLVQSGQHRVYGIARSEAKAKSLALNEIIPVICPDPVGEPTAYLNIIRQENIDVVVDVAGAFQGSAKLLQDIKTIGQERLDMFREAGIANGPKLGFIYCSGTWVHGSSNRPTSDLDVVGTAAASTQPPSLVAWRLDIEKSVLDASDVLDVAIVRPALIYGRESTIWTQFLLPVLQAARSGSSETVRIPLDSDSLPGLCHVDDVATGFKAVIERLPLLNTYPVFDLVTTQESMSAIVRAAASSWGLRGGNIELVGAGNDQFAEAMSTTFRGSSARARQLLDWRPTRIAGMTVDMDVYAAAFASQFP